MKRNQLNWSIYADKTSSQLCLSARTGAGTSVRLVRRNSSDESDDDDDDDDDKRNAASSLPFTVPVLGLGPERNTKRIIS